MEVGKQLGKPEVESSNFLQEACSKRLAQWGLLLNPSKVSSK